MARRVHFFSSTSTAPLTKTISCPSISFTVVISLRRESKGISPFLGLWSRTCSGISPASLAMLNSAVSMGSPSWPEALLLRTAPISRSLTSLLLLSFSSHDGCCCVWLTYTCSTSMRFCVRVPVLSEQITETHPRLSTAFKSFMIACSLAIFWVPMAWTMVTMELSASGMAATARATANIRASSTGSRRYRLSKNTRPQMAMMAMARCPENRSRLT